MGVRWLAVANGPNIFQMLLVYSVTYFNFDSLSTVFLLKVIGVRAEIKCIVTLQSCALPLNTQYVCSYYFKSGWVTQKPQEDDFSRFYRPHALALDKWIVSMH